MPDEQVNIDITATDHASKPIQDVAGAVKKLEDLEPEIVVEADAEPARKSVEDVLRVVDQLARDPATLVLTSNATDIARQITDLVGELDRLDANDPDVQVKAEQINSLQGDLDTLEAKLRDINDVPVEPKVNAAPATAEVDKLSDAGRGANSALANMVGNSAQDLGALGGVAGSAGVAIGQVAEYASDAALGGEALTSSLLTMAPVVGIVAALGLAFKTLTDAQAANAAAAKLSEERVSGFMKALQDGRPALDAYRDTIKETGELKFAGFGDVLPDMAKLNLTLDQFNALAAKTPDELQAWVDGQKKVAGGKDDMEALFHVTNALVTTQGDAATAAERLGVTQQVLGDEAQRYADMLAEQDTKLNASTASAAAATRAQADQADQLDRVNQLLHDQADALTAQVDAATSAADAQRAENQAMADYGTTLADNKATTDDVVDSAIALAKAHQDTAAEQAKANGQTQTATANLDTLNDGLLSTASTAKGPARDGILAYIGSVNQIPPEKLTEIQAAIDRGDLETAKTLLNQASAPRTAAVNADANTAAAEGDLNRTARDRNMTIHANVIANPPRYADGRPVAGLSMLPVPPDGGGPVVQPVVNVTQYLPRGWRGDALAESRRAARRSGGLYQRFSR